MAQTAMMATTRAMMSEPAVREPSPLGEKPCLAWVWVRMSAAREELAAPATVAPAVANHPAAPATPRVNPTANVAANPPPFLTMECHWWSAAWATTSGDGAPWRGPAKFAAGADRPRSHPDANLVFRELADTLPRRGERSASSG